MSDFFDLIKKKDFMEILHSVTTPAVVYSKKVLKSTLEYLLSDIQYINKIQLFYSVKANYNIEILQYISNFVYGVDIASEYEYSLADKAGFTNRIITSPAPSKTFLQRIYNDGYYFDFNSMSSLHNAKDIIRNKDIGLRFHMPVDHSSRFGIDCESVSMDSLEEYNIKIKRLHYHSGEYTLEKIEHICQYLLSICRRKKWFKNVEYVSLGGGLYKINKLDNLMRKKFWDVVSECVNEINLFQNVNFIFEPGCGIVMDSGFLVASVVDAFICNDRQYVMLDASAFNMFTWHCPQLVSVKERCGIKTNIYGMTCYEHDLFCRDIYLPKLESGDRLLFSKVGAYSASLAKHLHAIPFPKEIFV